MRDKETGASVPFTFDCAGQGNALCRLRFALLLVVLGALMLLCFPVTMVQWLARRTRRTWRRHGH